MNDWQSAGSGDPIVVDVTNRSRSTSYNFTIYLQLNINSMVQIKVKIYLKHTHTFMQEYDGRVIKCSNKHCLFVRS